MQPPLALLVYRPDLPRRAAFFPLAEFSPEWQALRYAAEHAIPARFCDLPQAISLAREPSRHLRRMRRSRQWSERRPFAGRERSRDSPTRQEDEAERCARFATIPSVRSPRRPGMQKASSGGRKRSSVAGMRGHVRGDPRGHERTPGAWPVRTMDEQERQREAWMRQSIRQAEKEGFARIAVVCGAWHAPALAAGRRPATIAALLSGLEKVKVEATWIPWTHARLARDTGYGAGIACPVGTTISGPGRTNRLPAGSHRRHGCCDRSSSMRRRVG